MIWYFSIPPPQIKISRPRHFSSFFLMRTETFSFQFQKKKMKKKSLAIIIFLFFPDENQDIYFWWPYIVGFNCGTNNPCNPLRTPGIYNYPHVNKGRYVQCSEDGKYSVMSCSAGWEWDPQEKGCKSTKNG